MVEVVTVAAGVVVTLLIAGMVLYWIASEWRGSSARRAPPHDPRVDHPASEGEGQTQDDRS